MPRTDENGKQLQAVLSYLLDTAVTDVEMRTALTCDTRTYQRQRDREDFPSAEECRRVARHFKINPVGLMVRFGLLDADDIQGFLSGPLASRGNTLTTRSRRGHLPIRNDVPPV